MLPFNPHTMYELAKQRHDEDLQIAQEHRLARAAAETRSRCLFGFLPDVSCRLFSWLGQRLIVWGVSLNRRYGAMPENLSAVMLHLVRNAADLRCIEEMSYEELV